MTVFRHFRMTGFTLLEVLIAVAITASIGVGAVQLLGGIIQARDATSVRSDQLAALQRFNALVGRDVEQFINRTIRDQYGDEQSSLILDGSDYLLEFTRTGWRNRPGAEDPRSELQRVAYALRSIDSDDCAPALRRLTKDASVEPEHECLVRYAWPVLDRAEASEPQAMVVLDQVISLEINVLGRTEDSGATSDSSSSDWYSAWPIVQSGGTELTVPVALRWKIGLPWLGEIERLWLVAHDREGL